MDAILRIATFCGSRRIAGDKIAGATAVITKDSRRAGVLVGMVGGFILARMKLAVVIACVALPIGAQEVVSLPVGTPRPDASNYRPVPADAPAATQDPNLHANVLTLIQLTGDRGRLETALPKLLSEGRAKMLKAYPNISPAFGQEWERRMAARISVDEFLEVTASVYEKHFTSDQIQQLIAMFKAKQEGKPVTAPEALQQKLTAEMPAILSEIAEGTTQVAVKLGSQIGREIAKEHPEYLLPKPAATSRIKPS